MFDEVGLPIQKKCVVAFIDFLGVSHKIKKDSQWTLNWLWIFYTIIVKEIDGYKNIKFKIFSDNILICREIENNNQSAVLEVLSIVDKIEMLMFMMGALFLRGAVVVDDMHFSSNFIYGKALSKAYELESNLALYPRIIIDSSVINLIDIKNTFITLDKDGQYFYNFLQSRIDKGKRKLSQDLGMFCGNILTNLKSNVNNPVVVNKMEWAINYFNETCQKNQLKHKISEMDLNQIGINTSSIHIFPKLGSN